MQRAAALFSKRAWFRLDEATIQCIERDLVEPPHRRSGNPMERSVGTLSTQGVAAHLDVSTDRVNRWVSEGLLVPIEGGGKGHAHWFRLDEPTDERLTPSAGRFRALRQKEPGKPTAT